MNIPRVQLKNIHQIEITSNCNLRCVYCVSPKLQRPKVDMSRQTFERALAMAKHLQDRFGVSELNLAGIGESTIHPDFVEYVHRARAVMGPQTPLLLATNGVRLAEDDGAEIVKQLAAAGVIVYVSLHRPEKAKIACDLIAEANILGGISIDPTVAATDWAGQVKGWRVTADEMECPWVSRGWGFVLADGRISACCFDGSGVGVFGSVDDKPETLFTKPYSLCETCNQTHVLPEHPDYVQHPKRGLPVVGGA